MITVADFSSKYEQYTDEELYEVYLNSESYSNEALEALGIVLEKKGRLDLLLKRLQEKQIIINEINRIAIETANLLREGVDSSLIKTTASSKILSAIEVDKIIDSKIVEVEAKLEDKKIKPRTVVGSITGGLIASLIGGILWGLQMIYSNRIFYIFIVGLVLLSYGMIKLFTKQ